MKIGYLVLLILLNTFGYCINSRHDLWNIKDE